MSTRAFTRPPRYSPDTSGIRGVNVSRPVGIESGSDFVRSLGDVLPWRYRAKETGKLALTLLSAKETVRVFDRFKKLGTYTTGTLVQLLTDQFPPSLNQSLEVQVSGVDIFGGRKDPMVGLRISSPNLLEERERLTNTMDELLDTRIAWGVFNPHITIAYANRVTVPASKICGSVEAIAPDVIELLPGQSRIKSID